jgi:hypothetical protein
LPLQAVEPKRLYRQIADQLAQSNARIEAGGKALGRD